MKFIVKTEDGRELEPVDQGTLVEWVDQDKIYPATPIRNSMMPAWKAASDYDFLKEALQRQEDRVGEADAKINPELAQANSFSNRFLNLFGMGVKDPSKQHFTTSFKNKLQPDPASVVLRLRAGFSDAVYLTLLALLIALFGTGAVYLKARMGTDSESDAAKTVLDARQKVMDTLKRQAEEAEKLYQSIQQKAAESGSDEEKKKAEQAKANLETAKQKVAKPGKADAAAAAVAAVEEFQSAEAPTVVDDEQKGFHAGSVWCQTGTSVNYTCVSAASSAALWCPTRFLSSVFLICFAVYGFCFWAYFAVSLGFWAQTPGMYYWGIFLARHSNLDLEALSCRAYLFAVLAVVLFPLMPFFVMAGRRTVAEVLTDTWVIRIAAKAH